MSNNLKLRVASALALASIATPALAVTINGAGGQAVAQSAFDSFARTVVGWVSGPLGIGLAITAMIIGAVAGLMKSTAMPAVVGVGVAAIFAWGPGIISSMITDGSTSGLL